MAFDSFRDFVNALDKAGELKRISQPVATELEITEIADREMKLPGGGKALLFEKPTVNGVVSPFPVAINTLGSHKRMAMSMNADSVDEVANELGATTPLTVGCSNSSALPPPGNFISRSAISVISSSVATGWEMRFSSPAASSALTKSRKESKAISALKLAQMQRSPSSR